MPVCLLTSTEERIEHPSDALIEETIRDLPNVKDAFLILERSPMTYMQTYWSEDGYELEFQEETVDQHYRVASWLTRDEVIRAFQRYAANDPSWRKRHEFERLDPQTWKPPDLVLYRRYSLFALSLSPFLLAGRAAFWIYSRCARALAKDKPKEEPVVRLPNVFAEYDYLRGLRCDGCGGAWNADREKAAHPGVGLVHDHWNLTCKNCRKTKNLILEVPDPPTTGVSGQGG